VQQSLGLKKGGMRKGLLFSFFFSIFFILLPYDQMYGIRFKEFVESKNANKISKIKNFNINMLNKKN